MKKLRAVLILFAAVFISYAPAWRNGFVWDDTALILRDPLVRKVRVAHHAGRMRLVIDLATDDVPAYDLVSRGGTVTLSLGAARPAATTPPEHH